MIATTLLTREPENRKSLKPHPANTNVSLSVSSCCCRPYTCLPKTFLYVTLPPPLSEPESWSKVNHLKYLVLQFFLPTYAHAQAICSSVFDSPNIITGNILNYQPHLFLACFIFCPSASEVTFYFKEWCGF